MPRPVHRAQARTFVIGVVTLAVLGVVAWIGVTVQGGGELPGRSYTYVKAAFNDVGMLKPREEVVQNGVRIGQVDSIKYHAGHAVVTMRLEGERPVYRDARARVMNKSVVGGKQLYLDPGTPTAGRLGSRTIPVSRTGDSAVLDDVLSVFDKRTRKALRSSLLELGGGLAGHGHDLRDAVRAAPGMLADVGNVSGALASPEADLSSLLAAANRLAGRFARQQQQLTALIEQTDTTFRAINVDGRKPLNDTVQALPATLQQARAGLRSLNTPLANVQSAMTTMRPGGQALGAATDDLRGFLRESVQPLGKVAGVSQQASPAVEDLTYTIADARPLVPRLSRTVADARVLLSGLSPYAADIGRLFSEHDLLSGKFAPDRHYFSAMLAMPGLYNVSLDDPTADTVPYPEPGTAWEDHEGGGR